MTHSVRGDAPLRARLSAILPTDRPPAVTDRRAVLVNLGIAAAAGAAGGLAVAAAVRTAEDDVDRRLAEAIARLEPGQRAAVLALLEVFAPRAVRP